MTLLYLDGFEGYSADIDFKSRPGWYTCNGVTNANCQTAFPAAVTEIGNSLTFSTAPPTSGNCPYNATYSKNNGVAWSNGTTVYQGWKAGGFSMGMRLKNNGATQPYTIEGKGAGINSGNSIAYIRLTDTIGFDGVNYWAIGQVGSTNYVVYSPDLRNWKLTLTNPVATYQPSYAIESTGIVCFGVGCVAVARFFSTNEFWNITTDGGVTWTHTNTFSANGTGAAIPSGNATTPIIIASNVASALLAVTAAGGTTSLAALTNASNVGAVVSGGLAIGWMTNTAQNAVVYSALYGAGNIGTAGAWTTATLTFPSPGLGPSGLVGMAYSPKLNKWCLIGSQGVALLAANGTPGNVQPITTATVQLVFNPLDVPIAVLCINNVLCVYCQGGTIYYSGDGYTWNQTYIPQIPTLATATWDGSRVIFTSTAATGIIVASSDGFSNFSSIYVADSTTTYAQVANANLPNMITVEPNANPLLLNGSLWTYPGGNAANVYRMGFYPGALTSVRGVPVIPIYVGVLSGTGTWTNQQTVYIDGSTVVHYYEIVATADPKNVNSFFWSLLVDGNVVYKTPASYSMAPMADTTSYLMFEPLCTSQAFNQFDDLYICLNDGKGISGPQGPNIVLPLRPSGNVQNAWTAVGTQSSNALALAGPTPSTNKNGVVSGNVSDKDVYTLAALPAGYQPAAVCINAAVSRVATGGSPQVAVGIITNGAEQDGNTAVTTPLGANVIASMIAERAPDGSAWTSANLASSQLAITHTQ